MKSKAHLLNEYTCAFDVAVEKDSSLYVTFDFFSEQTYDSSEISTSLMNDWFDIITQIEKNWWLITTYVPSQYTLTAGDSGVSSRSWW